MTKEEASRRYRIPSHVLDEYESWGLCGAVKKVMGVWQYDDEDLERLSTIMTLHDIGFTAEEVETYMRLLLEQPDSDGQRLTMTQLLNDFLSGSAAWGVLLTLAACGTTDAGNDAADEPKNDAAADAADPDPTGETPESTDGKVLVAYFSATGHTRTIAEYLQTALDADLYEIVPQEPYTADDLDYNTDGCRANQEQHDDLARPAISGSVEDMDGYDVVFIDWLTGQRFSSGTSAADVQSWADSLGL